jgi:uncharacterized damage-inducible protein DinB
MITPEFARTMAAYNAEMNRRLYAAASRLSDEERRLPRGAFWGSIHATFNHILWGDQSWMSRFDDWPKPAGGIKQSGALAEDFAELIALRFDADRRIADWAGRLDQAWLDGELSWFSHAAGREVRRARGFLVAHFFNHQTHHRGQAHAMLTAAGQQTGDTDLFLVVP